MSGMQLIQLHRQDVSHILTKNGSKTGQKTGQSDILESLFENGSRILAKNCPKRPFRAVNRLHLGAGCGDIREGCHRPFGDDLSGVLFNAQAQRQNFEDVPQIVKTGAGRLVGFLALLDWVATGFLGGAVVRSPRSSISQSITTLTTRISVPNCKSRTNFWNCLTNVHHLRASAG